MSHLRPPAWALVSERWLAGVGSLPGLWPASQSICRQPIPVLLPSPCHFDAVAPLRTPPDACAARHPGRPTRFFPTPNATHACALLLYREAPPALLRTALVALPPCSACCLHLPAAPWSLTPWHRRVPQLPAPAAFLSSCTCPPCRSQALLCSAGPCRAPLYHSKPLVRHRCGASHRRCPSSFLAGPRPP